MSSDDGKMKAGDRVEYPFITKFQMGPERTFQEGEVIDVVDGVAGAVQVVFSRPDDPDLSPTGFRIDYAIEGDTSSMVRKL